jgi:hypothetical protein
MLTERNVMLVRISPIFYPTNIIYPCFNSFVSFLLFTKEVSSFYCCWIEAQLVPDYNNAGISFSVSISIYKRKVSQQNLTLPCLSSTLLILSPFFPFSLSPTSTTTRAMQCKLTHSVRNEAKCCW